MHKSFHLVITDIVNMIRCPTGSSVRISFVPVRISNRWFPDDQGNAFSNIINISKISFHLAIIEDIDRFSGQNSLGKEEIGHVRSPPWPINSKKA